MQRATISVSEGRFPEAHFNGRRIMEPSIGYALTRLCAQARMRGTGIHVEIDDAGTRLPLVIDEGGRLHTPPGAPPLTGGAPTRAQSDASAPTQALPVTPEAPAGLASDLPSRASTDHRRTFTSHGDPAPPLTPPDDRVRPRWNATAQQRTLTESAAPEPLRGPIGPDHAPPNSADAPLASEAGPVRGGLIAAAVLAAALIACGAVLLLT